MNRFDPDFNDIDPATQRAFSGDHPDGVWLIAIIFGLPVVMAALAAVAAAFMLVSGKFTTALGIFVAVAVVTFLYAPPILFLFRRSIRALTWVLGLLGLDLVMLAITFGLPLENPARAPLQMFGLVGAVLHGIFAYYLNRLRRQKLLE